MVPLRFCLGVTLVATHFMVVSPLTVAAQPPEDTRAAWPLVRIPDPLARRATLDALRAAQASFRTTDCRRLLTDFCDRAGRPLTDTLASLGTDIETYLTMVAFIDGSRHRGCATGVLALTAPGSRVVRLCLQELTRLAREQPDYVVAVIIHEILHTLGLGENPPTPQEITARALAQCKQ